MEGKGLLSLIIVSNDMECDENTNGNILIQAEKIDTRKENMSGSNSYRQLRDISRIPVNDITHVDSYAASAVAPLTMNPLKSRESLDMSNISKSLYDDAYFGNMNENSTSQSVSYTKHGNSHSYSLERPVQNISLSPINDTITVGSSTSSHRIPCAIDTFHSIDSAYSVPSTSSNQYVTETQTLPLANQFNSYNPNYDFQEDIDNELHIHMPLDSLHSVASANYLQSASSHLFITDDQSLSPIILFKSCIQSVNSQEDINNALCLPLSYQYMFDKRTSPWEMKYWDQDDLNAFVIQPEKIDRLYHIAANDEDPNFRSWELCCRIDYKGEKYFVEMYANCDYTGFDCQGGGHVCISNLADFFLNNMVTNDQNPDRIFKSLLEDGYDVQEPDPLHKMHPKFWNNTPMLKYLCHNAIYENKDMLPHYKENLPQILANSVDDFIQVKDWENE